MKRIILLIIVFSVSLKIYSQRPDTKALIQFGDTIHLNNEVSLSSIQPLSSNTNSFTETSAYVTGINLGSAEWVDYDSDGDLDIFINGYNLGGDYISHAMIYRNEGSNTFVKANITIFSQALYGDQDWGDYNNDGNIDLILTGTTSGFNAENVTEIHKNLGNGKFAKISHPLPRMSRSDVHWEDLDGDGDLDIFLMGLNSGSAFIAKIYVNKGDDTFEEGTDILTGGSGRINFNENASIWADLDNDGDIDGVLGYCSQSGGYGVKLYENLGNLNFEEKSTSLPQLNYASLDVFDFNNDNLIDIVISGTNSSVTYSGSEPAILAIMENTGNLIFEEFYNQLIGAYWGSIDCGDYNNDGFSDVLINGFGNNTQGTFILENSPSLNFQLKGYDLTSTHSGGALWGKLNPTSNLDIFIHGTTTNSSVDATSKLFQNENSISNTAPSIPTNINYHISKDTLKVSWTRSEDDNSGNNGIFYNVELGTSPNSFEKINGNSNESGHRKIVEIGNSGTNNSFTLLKFATGTYYFRVQAIDNGFNASEFSEIIEIINPGAELPDSLRICEFDSIQLNHGVFESYIWSTGETSPTIYADTEGWYTVTVKNSYGAISQDSTYIFVLSPPSLADTAFICQQDSALLAPGMFASYVWSTGQTSQVIYAKSAGWYSVTVENSLGCIFEDSTYIHINPLPPTPVMPDTVFICYQDSALLDPGVFESYTWSTGQTTSTIYTQKQGWYSVTVGNSFGCTSQDSTYIFVYPLPSLVDTVYICPQDSALLDPGAFKTYSWNTGQNSQSIYANTEGWYCVMVENSFGCVSKDSTYVSINPLPEPTLVDTLFICQQDSALLDPGQFKAYRWNTGQSSQTLYAKNEGWYTVAVENSFGCIAEDSTYIQVNPLPTPALSDTVFICQRDSAILDPGEFTSYLWSTGNTTQRIYPKVEGWYGVNVENSFGCTSQDSTYVLVHPLPSLADTVFICQQDSALLDPGMFTSYVWSTGQTSQKIYAKTGGWYRVMVENTFGCIYEDSSYLRTNPILPSPALADTVFICYQDSALLDPGEFESYLWNTGQTSSTIYAKNEGWYHVMLENSFGCASKDSTYVLVYPFISLEVKDTIVMENDIIEIDPGLFETYQWSDGSTDSVLRVEANKLKIGDNIYSLSATNQNGCILEDEFVITVEKILGLGKSIDSKFELSYINGTLSIWNNSNTQYWMNIYSITGTLLYQDVISPNSEIVTAIDFGLKIISFQDRKHLYIKKIYFEE